MHDFAYFRSASRWYSRLFRPKRLPASASSLKANQLVNGSLYAMTTQLPVTRSVYSQPPTECDLVSALPTGCLGAVVRDSSNGLLLASRQKDSSPTNFTGADQFLIATNAASNSISVFRLRDNDGPLLVDVVPSNGEHPVSVTVSGGILYVLNNGDAAFAPPPNCAAGPGVPNHGIQTRQGAS